MSVVAQLAGWTPIRVYGASGRAHVDWARLGTEPFTDPFFEQTLGRAMRNPAQLLFRRETSADALEAFAEDAAGVPPTGFIFHWSRCGSTLVAQMLAALADSVVVSEAPAIDEVLAVARRVPGVTHEQRLRWFRGMVRALGRPRRGNERRYFIKFDSWHVLELPLIREAFPDVPWIFLYRDPVEVLVSHQRRPGSQMLPGVLDPRLFGIEPASLAGFSLEEYAARVLARIGIAAAFHLQADGGRAVNFTELPGALWTSLGGTFGVEWTDDDLGRLQRAACFDAKSPTQLHVDDRAGKQREASEEVRVLAEAWVGEAYRKLEGLRGVEGRSRPAGDSNPPAAHAASHEIAGKQAPAFETGQAVEAAASARAASARSSSRSQSFTTQSTTR